MPDSYALATQKAIVRALKANAGVAAAVGGRVYGRRVPNEAQRPYVWINNIVVRDLRSDCGSAATVTFGVEAVSRDVQAADVEASRCAEAVNASLDTQPITVDGFTLVQLHRLTETSGDAADGKSFEVVSAYQAILDN
tara:strand:- start:8198 stop:8611 length:414 start_codon:yes stop_codon:yes gene_type:complete